MWEILIVLIFVGLVVLAIILPRKREDKELESAERHKRFGKKRRRQLGED